jgi:hypothetical protein
VCGKRVLRRIGRKWREVGEDTKEDEMRGHVERMGMTRNV